MTKPSLRNLKKPNEATAVAIVEAQEIREVSTRKKKPYDKKMSLYVDDDLWKSLQLRKIDTGRDVNSIVKEAIWEYLSKGSGV